MANCALQELHRPLRVGMEQYVVLFDTWRASAGSRSERMKAQADLADANRGRLVEFVKMEGLTGEVASVAQGTVLGAIGVVMTPAAARRIEKLDGVTRVIRDG